MDGKSVFSFVRNCSTDFQSGFTILHVSRQWMRVSVAPHPCQHLMLSVVLDFSHLGIIVVFTVKLPNDMRCGTSFHMLSCLLLIFFDEVSIQIFCPLSVRLFPYCWVLCVLCIVWIVVLFQICVLQVFSLNLWFVFSFPEQKF